MPDEKGGLATLVNLSKVAGYQLAIEVQLVGIPSSGANSLSYKELATVPLSELQLTAAAIVRQKNCPVSGKTLGSMGDPVAENVGKEKVFVCCAGCVSAVKANPAKFASGKLNVEILAASAADSTLIAKQAKCPVMDEPLDSMGQPVKLLVGGKPLFLCCKGCVRKVQAEPAKYLAMVYEETNVTVPKGTEQVRDGVFKVTDADKTSIAVQKKCPVMDEPLDAMGGAYKANAAGKAIYICCPGCAKKIAAEPDKYLTVLKSHGVKAPAIR
jgi:YHS domain-containing protein